MRTPEQRKAVADFLRARRAALDPAVFDLPHTARRRTAGLRREEVAQLAGISPAWYVRLEQGQEVHPSVEVLASLARALRLNAAEEAYLFQLAACTPPTNEHAESAHVGPRLRKFLDQLGPRPAYVLDEYRDVIAWNPAAAAVFIDFGQIPPAERNLPWLVFTCTALRDRFVDLESYERALVAHYRAAFGPCVADPRFLARVAALQETSPTFERWWATHEMCQESVWRKVVRHPQAGRLVFDYVTLAPPGMLAYRVVIHTPAARTNTRMRVAALLRLQRRAGRASRQPRRRAVLARNGRAYGGLAGSRFGRRLR